MKRRIIGMLLVAVMLIGSLVSCGYSYEKDDLSKYATFDKDAFEKAISALVIEDGDFTKDADTRADKVIDTIRKALAKKADTDDKKTEGVIGEYDTFYYCYYGTITVDGEEKVIFASSMKQSSATNFQFGLKDTEGLQAKIEAAFKDYDLTEKAYSTTTSGKAESGKIAYISYTVEYDKDGKSVTENYENVRVTLGEGSDVAKKLAGATIGTAINSFTGETDKKDYSKAKVLYTVDVGSSVTVKDTTYTEKNNVKDTAGKTHDVKDLEITYHVYPVYYLEVEDYTASSVLELLVSSLLVADKDDATKKVAALDCLKGQETLLEELEELLDVVDEKQTAVDDAEKDVTDAEEALQKEKDSIKEGEEPNANQADVIKKHEETLADAKADLEDAKSELEKAKGDVDEKLKAIFEKVPEKDIIKEYDENTYDSLLTAYNREIKDNLAAKIWEALQNNTKVEGYPRKAVQETYDRLIEGYRYTFHTGMKDSTKKISYYKYYSDKGGFEGYLKDETGADSYANAKHAVWADAVEYVTPIVIIYNAAKAYDVITTKEEYKEFQESETSSYSYYEYSYGEDNVRVAVQFDKLMNTFLVTEETEDDKVVDLVFTHELIKNFKIQESKD